MLTLAAGSKGYQFYEEAIDIVSYFLEENLVMTTVRWCDVFKLVILLDPCLMFFLILLIIYWKLLLIWCHSSTVVFSVSFDVCVTENYQTQMKPGTNSFKKQYDLSISGIDREDPDDLRPLVTSRPTKVSSIMLVSPLSCCCLTHAVYKSINSHRLPTKLREKNFFALHISVSWEQQ